MITDLDITNTSSLANHIPLVGSFVALATNRRVRGVVTAFDAKTQKASIQWRSSKATLHGFDGNDKPIRYVGTERVMHAADLTVLVPGR